MAALKTYLVCGCAASRRRRSTGHRPGCWLGEAENIAAEAVGFGVDGDESATATTVAVVQALAEAGYLAGLTCDRDVWNLLDTLTEAGLLAAPGGA